jgi:triacylglycerol esterase/lipase EstA (alpha/beta hydrolase family)
MGGILVGRWLSDVATATERERIGRIVMLGPPNHGSEIVDKLGGWLLFRLLNGAFVVSPNSMHCRNVSAWRPGRSFLCL